MKASAEASVLALGSHGGGRMTGLVLTSTATDMLRHAQCSVLVARPPFDEDSFPRRIAVAFDGSEPALQALEIARQIVAQRAGTPEIVAVTAGRVPSGAVAEIAAPYGETAQGVAWRSIVLVFASRFGLRLMLLSEALDRPP